jgi:hypothetical protein
LWTTTRIPGPCWPVTLLKGIETGRYGLAGRHGGSTVSLCVSRRPEIDVLSSAQKEIVDDCGTGTNNGPESTVYEKTSEIKYLNAAWRLGKLFLDHLISSPATVHGVPPWDFDAPAPAPPDTSAATLATNALLHMALAEQTLGK